MAKWSQIRIAIKKKFHASYIKRAANTPPSVKPRTKKGQYPHLQPFNDNLRPANRRKSLPMPMAA